MLAFDTLSEVYRRFEKEFSSWKRFKKNFVIYVTSYEGCGVRVTVMENGHKKNPPRTLASVTAEHVLSPKETVHGLVGAAVKEVREKLNDAL